MRFLGACSLGVVGILACALPAQAESIGFHLQEADLVATGVLQRDAGGSGEFTVYVLAGPEILKGDPPGGIVRVVRPEHICYHVDLPEGEAMLLFLRRIEAGELEVLPGGGYLALAAELSAVPLRGEEGALLVEAARTQLAALDAGAATRARVAVQVLRAGLSPGRERLLQSALVDAVRTPGALAALDQLDELTLLERFRAAGDGEAPGLQRSLLDALGELMPAGIEDELVKKARSPAGAIYRDQIAAILTRCGGDEIPWTLAAGFDDLDEASRENVLYVLGHLGRGKGVAAIRSLMWRRQAGVQSAAVAALQADRSEAAVAALGELAEGARRHKDALDAVEALARINTPQSRSLLAGLARAEHGREQVTKHAEESLARLRR